MSKTLWTSTDSATATGGKSTCAWTATGVSIDSRSLVPGDLFIALHGPNFDGHDFVAKALKAGAAAAMVDKVPEGMSDDTPLLVVTDTMAGLSDLAAAARKRTRAKITAITGSVGKTGTKEALRQVLERQGATTASQGNLNNQWGAPLSLARMPKDTEYGIFELGMNHPGEIAPLSMLARPDVAIITNIEPVHAEFFTSIGAIADAKAEIFNGLAGGTAILLRESPFFPLLCETAKEKGVERIIGFGNHPDADARLIDCTLHPDQSDATAIIDGQRIDFHLSIPGRHLVINCLAVLAAVGAVGGDVAQAAAALGTLEAVEGRGRHNSLSLPKGSLDLYDESYNASPASMRAAISVLSHVRIGKGGRRIAVLGDMLELGDDGPRMHAGLATDLIEGGIDLVFTAGKQMAHLSEALPEAMRGGHANDAATLAPIVIKEVKAGDAVTVKGSLGMAMAEVVNGLKALGENPPSAANGS